MTAPLNAGRPGEEIGLRRPDHTAPGCAPHPLPRQLCHRCHGAYAQPVFYAAHACWVCGGTGYARREVQPEEAACE